MTDTSVIPDPRGIGYEYFNAMIKYRERVAQVDGRTGEEETYNNLLKRSVRTAITMKSQGIKPGDFVSMCTLNELDACVIYIATLFVGAITANVHVTMSAQEIVSLLKQVSPKIVFVAQQYETLMENVTRELEGQPPLVVLGQTPTNTPFAKFLESRENEDAFRPREVQNMDETVFVAFTSGTTGKPKGICHSHSSMVERFDKEQKCQTYATFYPPTLTLFNRFVHYTILNGFRRLVFDRFDFEDPWRILNYTVDFTLLTPIATTAFFNNKKPDHLDLGNLRRLTVGGNHSTKDHILKLRELFPKTVVCKSYGQSEVFARITEFPEGERGQSLMNDFPDSIGLLRKAFNWKVVNVESEEILGPNKEGELRLKTEYLMRDYLNYEPHDLFDSVGWYRTGDLVYYNEHGCIFVVGRATESFKYRNTYIHPREIEEIILTHRSVQNAVVIGLEHETEGYLPTAVVQLNENEEQVTPDDIIEYVNKRVYDTNLIRGGVQFIKQFPLTPSIKIQRSKLKEMLRNNLI